MNEPVLIHQIALYLKHDGCGDVAGSYPAMRDALNATQRRIYFSVHGPKGGKTGSIANCWRTTGDIDNTWDSIAQRAKWNDAYATASGPELGCTGPISGMRRKMAEAETTKMRLGTRIRYNFNSN